MPSKDLACEFCDDKKAFRKNDLAKHIKAKHHKELANFILEEYKEEPQTNTLKRYASCINPSSNPICSKLYPNGAYYFGVNPMFFEEDDSYGSYIRSDDNMKEHNRFLCELISHITLADYFTVERELIIRSESFVSLQREKRAVDEKLIQMTVELESLKNHSAYQKQVIQDFKEATECSTTIQDMKKEMNYMRSRFNDFKANEECYKEKINRLEVAMEKSYYSSLEEHNLKCKALNDELDERCFTIGKLNTQIETLKTKQEALVNTRVEKEVKKVKAQLEKKHEEAVDELEDKIAELRKQLRRSKKGSDTESVESE